MGIRLAGVRLDSGDLVALSKSVRQILDDGGLREVTIFASGGLDEDELLAAVRANAPIDGFGVGTSLTTSSDVPALDCAYKLQEYAGPTAAQALRRQGDMAGTQASVAPLWRRWPDGWRCPFAGGRSAAGRAVDPGHDAGGATHKQTGEPDRDPRARGRQHKALPEPLRRLDPNGSYSVTVADRLVRLATEVDKRLI